MRNWFEVGEPGAAAAQYIRQHASSLAESVLRRLQHSGSLSAEPGSKWYQKSHRDVAYHLNHLAEALDFGRVELYSEHVGWCRQVFARLGFAPDVVDRVGEAMAAELTEALRPAGAELALAVLEEARLSNPTAVAPPPVLDHSHTAARAYLEALLALRRDEAEAIVLAAADRPLLEVYREILAPAQQEIGRRWQLGEVTVAHEHLVTSTTQMLMSRLLAAQPKTAPDGQVLVAAAPAHEEHTVGLRMLTDLVDGAGWRTVFLGARVPTADLLALLTAQPTVVLALSATMITSLGAVRDMVAAVRGESALARVRVLVGGRAFGLALDLWRQVGADGFAATLEGSLAAAHSLAAAV